jgi:HD superfamily phosphodiesterase
VSVEAKIGLFITQQIHFANQEDNEKIHNGHDHIKKKLMVLENSMHTKTAKKIAEERTEFMKLFINQLWDEILYKY